MTTDFNIVSEYDTLYNEAYYAWNPYFPLADRDLRFYLGDQWDEREKRDLFQEGRSTFVFNRVRRNIQLVSGYQRKHRLSSIVIPTENSDQETADQLSQLLLYTMNYGEAYRVISDCFGGALKTGWNLLSIWVDYRDDPVNGDIKFAREPYNGFIVDPYMTQLDLSDCSFLLRRKYLSVGQTASLLPDHQNEVYSLYRQGWERDDKFTWLPYQRQPNGEELMAYNEFYQQKWRNVPMLVDMETGETLEFDEKDDTVKLFLQQYPQLEVIQKPKRYIEKHIIVNDHYINTEINPYDLDEYPFVPVTAIFEPESDQWGLKVQSLIRCMIDPQREANRRRSQMIDILDSQINSGWIADENSVINPRSLFQSSQGKVIWKREDSRPGSLEKIPPAQIPPSMFQLQELFDRDMVEIPGINDAAFGITENAGESGVMMMLRQGASLVNLQDLFDNLRFSQKNISTKCLKLMQKWTPQKVKRIINQDPTQQFYEKNFTKYDVSVQEGMLTDTQKQMYFRQLVDLKQLGAPVSGEMLAEAAPIQGKTTYIKQLAQAEQEQAKQQQQQQQIQQSLIDSQRQLAQAKAISDIALSKERFTRAVANMGLQEERNAQAVHDRAKTVLDRAKAIKELESMDDERLIKYLTIARMMEETFRLEEKENKLEDVAITEASENLNADFPGNPAMQAVGPEIAEEQQMEVIDGPI